MRNKGLNPDNTMKVLALLLTFYSTILFAQEKPKLMLPVGHSSGANLAEFSPDSKLIITGSIYDNSAKIWDTRTRKVIHNLKGHNSFVYSAQFSQDGRYVVTGSGDGTAKIWDVKTGNLIHNLPGPENLVYSVQFTPDGKQVITASLHQALSIWDVGTGKLIKKIKDHSDVVRFIIFSKNSKYFVTASNDGNLKVWENGSWKLIHDLKPNQHGFSSVEFSPDGKYLLTTLSSGKTVKIWDISSGKILQDLQYEADKALFSPDGRFVLIQCVTSLALFELASSKVLYSLSKDDLPILSAKFSPDGKFVVAGVWESIRFWEADSGQLIREIIGHEKQVTDIQFSPDGKQMFTTSWDNTAIVWEASSGKLIQGFNEHPSVLSKAKFSPDGKYVICLSVSSNDEARAELIDNQLDLYEVVLRELGNKEFHNFIGYSNEITSVKFSTKGDYTISTSYDFATIWSNLSGQIVHNLKGHSWGTTSGEFSNEGRFVATSSEDSTAIIWEASTGKILQRLKGHSNIVLSVEFSSDGKYIVTASVDSTSRIWNTADGKLLHNLKGHTNVVNYAHFSEDGKYVVTSSDDMTSKIWDASSGKLIRDLKGHKDAVNDAVISPDGNLLITASEDETVKIWNAAGGVVIRNLKELNNFKGLNNQDIQNLRYSADGKFLASGSLGPTTAFWEVSSGKLIKTFQGKLMDVSSNWKSVITNEDSKLTLYDIESGLEKLSWILLDSVNWVVTHPSGLFDASPGALDKLYFVQGLDIIDFNQLKERYYEPGLWKKVMNGEELRNVVGMKSIDLPPNVQVGQVDKEGYLNINLTNRGGGIGEVNVFVNGKEIIKDARDSNVKSDAPTASVKVFVGKHKSIVKGQENFIGVKAWNKDHWVQSRGAIVSYESKEIETYKPAVHILTCGVSDYTGNEIDLKYAAKDANDVSQALQLGAKKLFGTERAYVYNLTTTQTKEFYPTKTNILKAFEKISTTSHPLDVFVMYVSGHGINYGGQDGDWHYLTQEAYTGSAQAYNDPSIRQQTTISSNELVEMFKKVPALKQVLMIDACASGKVVDNLMNQKDIESSTLRALDRMRDRTGMHIITGCTADAVSYEASKYGQGVLTYSILEGIRGAALREEQYVDVNKLFQYAQERVPKLAEGIGGIQSPQVFSPQGSQSFDIGLLGDNEKKEIPIAKIRPVYIRSNFQDENELEDVLGLGKLVDVSLNEVASKGTESPLIFVDVREYPEGCKLIGRYKKENGRIIMKLRRKCGSEDKTFEITGTDAGDVASKIIKIL